MGGWFGQAGRTDALERDLAALREQLAALDGRVAQETAALGARLAGIEARLDGVQPAIASAIGRIDRLESEPEVPPGALDELRTSLLRIDRQLRAQADEADKLAAALLERIEALRDRRGGL